MKKDPLTPILLALGAATILGPTPLSIVTAAMISAGLVGLHRALGKRTPLVLIGAVVVLWVLQHFWDLLPVDAYKLSSEHKTLYDTPAFLANVVLVGLFAAIPIVARPRIGNGLMVLALASLGMGVVAKGPLLVVESKETAALLFGAIEHGWLGVATRVVAIAFVAAAFEPKVSRLEKRGLVIVAVIGAALFAATYDTLPEHVSGGNDLFYVLIVGSMVLAWILSAIGFAGVARAGGGTGSWIAMALSIVQIPTIIVALAFMDRSQSMLDPVGAFMVFGLLAIGLAGVTAPAMSLRVARGIAGVLALSALFGTLATLVLLLAAAMKIVHVREVAHPLHTYAIPIVGHAAVAWASCLAYLVSPPSDKVAA